MFEWQRGSARRYGPSAPEDDRIDPVAQVLIAQVRVPRGHPTILVAEQGLQPASLRARHRLIRCERMPAVM